MLRSPGLGVSLVVSARHSLPLSPKSPGLSGGNSGLTFQASDISIPRTLTSSSLESRVLSPTKSFNKKAHDLSPIGESNALPAGLEHVLAAHSQMMNSNKPNRSHQSVSISTKHSAGPRVLSTAAYRESVRLGLTPEELVGALARVRPSYEIWQNFYNSLTSTSQEV